MALLNYRILMHYKHLQPIKDELDEGYKLVGHLPRHVTIFGSARTGEDDETFQNTEKLAYKLATKGHHVATGAGDCGEMLAGNRGTWRGSRDSGSGALSIGYGIELDFEAGNNKYCDVLVECKYFNTRKWFLITRASAIIVSEAGGLGTLEELTDAWVKVQCKKIKRPLPIVLMGTEFWGGFIDWLRNMMLKKGYISEEDLDLILVTDDIDEAIAHIESKT